MNDFVVDFGSALPYVVDSVLALFGKDAESVGYREKIDNHIRVSINDAKLIQCVGMSFPVDIHELYIPTRFVVDKYSVNYDSDFIDVLLDPTDSYIIYSGPGYGKSTLLHWLYLSMLKDSDIVPILITLRHPDAIEKLKFFAKKIQSKKVNKVLFLVDGYDEVDRDSRIVVSKILRELKEENQLFILTCREHYSVIDLKGISVHISGFDIGDAEKYCRFYFEAIQASVMVSDFISELLSKGFCDFVKNPLLLTLACVLKTRSQPMLPRTSIGLIRRAVETLTMRWDEHRGICRKSRFPIDGEDRIRLLMYIAYGSRKLVYSEPLVLARAREFLVRMQYSSIPEGELLYEIAQWFGLFVPNLNASWVFAHKSIHDYLAARYWVESGDFSKGRIKKYDTRAAYAACLIPDSTAFIRKSLVSSDDLVVLEECIDNGAYFDPKMVARGIYKHFSRLNKGILIKHEIGFRVKVTELWFDRCKDDLLQALGEVCSNCSDRSAIILCLSAAFQLLLRGKNPNFTCAKKIFGKKCVFEFSSYCSLLYLSVDKEFSLIFLDEDVHKLLYNKK